MKFARLAVKVVLGFWLALFSASALCQQILTDQNQREVVLPDAIERIVGITVPSAFMVIALDEGAHRLVGINPIAKRQINDGLMRYMVPESQAVPGNMAGDGFAPNVEAILAAQPDVVFQWGDRGESILKPIENVNIPVVTFKYGKTDYVNEWLRLTGQAIRRDERAAGILAYLNQTRARVEQQVAQSEQPKPRVLFVFRYRAGFQVAGWGTSMHTDIERAGGINVAAEQQGFKSVNIEQLLVWNPDIILLTNFEPGLKPAALLENPLLANIAAVQQNRVYQYPKGGFAWDPPSQESALTWQWLYGLFYPHNETNNLREQIRAYYQLLYRYCLDDTEIDQILRMDKNQHSQYYTQRYHAPLKAADEP